MAAFNNAEQLINQVANPLVGLIIIPIPKSKTMRKDTPGQHLEMRYIEK